MRSFFTGDAWVLEFEPAVTLGQFSEKGRGSPRILLPCAFSAPFGLAERAVGLLAGQSASLEAGSSRGARRCCVSQRTGELGLPALYLCLALRTAGPLVCVWADVRARQLGQGCILAGMAVAHGMLQGKTREPEVHGGRDRGESGRRSRPPTGICDESSAGCAACRTVAGQTYDTGGLPARGRPSRCRSPQSTGPRCRNAPICAAACLLITLLPLNVWAAPALLTPRNAPVSGGHTMTITGYSMDDFGTGLSYPKVRVGGTAALTTTWVSKTAIKAVLPPGILLPHARMGRWLKIMNVLMLCAVRTTMPKCTNIML